MKDESYIKLALEIAKKGKGNVSPNPLVGCVIVKNNRIISAAYHKKYGKGHAEINAINKAKENIEGASLFVNLEPCSHHGKTPPCVDKIIEKKIKKVVIGISDPNPLVKGKGIKKLKAAGIEVKAGILEEECKELNKFFFKYITEKIPYVTLKAAQTLDGKIAASKGDSKWISSLQARKFVHQMRAEYDAVLVGTNTVLKDNPKLTVRLSEGRNPIRVVIDTDLKLSNKLKIFNNESPLIILTSNKNKSKKSARILAEEKVENLLKQKVKILFIKEDSDGMLNLKNILIELGKEKIASLLVEGGSALFSSFVKKKLFDDIFLFISPKLIGNGIPVIGDINKKSIKSALDLQIKSFEKVGDDILLELSK